MKSDDEHSGGRHLRDRPFRILPLVYRGLIIFLIILGLLIIGGTIYGLFFQDSSLGRKNIDVSQKSGEGQTFKGIGRLRISTTDPQPGMVILSVSFIYYPEDKAFSEELALRVGGFRDIITNYIGSFSIAKLKEKTEEDIKTELLRQFNSILRLGKIESLFFSDFMVIE